MIETSVETWIEASGTASAAQLVVACAHCGARAEVSVKPSQPEAAPPSTAAAPLSSSPTPSPSSSSSSRAATDAGAARCPKCHAVVGDRASCPGCGLATSRMAGFAAARDASVPDELRAAWQRVVDSWQDQPRHDAFVQLAASASAFAWAAGQYQEVRRQRPDDAIARRQLERVRRTTEAAMLASAAAVGRNEKAPYRSATAILVMLVVVLVAGALYATFMRETRTPGPVTPVMPVRSGPARY